MSLFLVAWTDGGKVDPDGVAAAVREPTREIPPLVGRDPVGWAAPSGRAALASIAHEEGLFGGVRYLTHLPGRAAMFAGRPVVCTDDDTASGRRALDPEKFLEPAEGWARHVDGRWAEVRYDDETGRLPVYSDHLGSYPCYSARPEGTVLVMQPRRAAPPGGARLRDARRGDGALLGSTWALGGMPLWEGVERLERGRLHQWTPGNGHLRRELLPLGCVAGWFGRAFSAERAGRCLRAVTGALAAWRGRPILLPLTGGRDSRVVLAGALEAGVDFSVETSALPRLPGYPETGDVRVARLLCEAVSRPHRVNASSDRPFELRDALRVLRLATPGTFSLGGISPNMASGFLAPDVGAPLRLLLSGACGETWRAYYGTGDGLDRGGLVEQLSRRMLHAWPRPLLPEGVGLVREHVSRWVSNAVEGGLAPRDVPDACYLLERMPNCAGTLHATSEYARDVLSPLWSRFVVRHQMGLRWIGLGTTARGRGRDPLYTAFAEIRAGVLAAPDHPAWEVLGPRATARLLKRDAARLGPRSRDQAWRLATLFLGATDPSATRSATAMPAESR